MIPIPPMNISGGSGTGDQHGQASAGGSFGGDSWIIGPYVKGSSGLKFGDQAAGGGAAQGEGLKDNRTVLIAVALMAAVVIVALSARS